MSKPAPTLWNAQSLDQKKEFVRVMLNTAETCPGSANNVPKHLEQKRFDLMVDIGVDGPNLWPGKTVDEHVALAFKCANIYFSAVGVLKAEAKKRQKRRVIALPDK